MNKTALRTLVMAVIISGLTVTLAVCAENPAPPFVGEVTEDGINLRTDSTVTSELILKLNKTIRVNVNAEKHGWYKVKLPILAPSYIKKTLVSTLSSKTGKISKPVVNIRLRPSESSPIIGKAYQDEVITLTEDTGEWYRIEPVANSYGWVNKKFIALATGPVAPLAPAPAAAAAQVSASATVEPATASPAATDHVKIIEGVVKSYGTVFWRIATHQITTDTGEVYLLKGDKKKLNALRYHRVRVVGKLMDKSPLQHPIIEVDKLEALN